MKARTSKALDKAQAYLHDAIKAEKPPQSIEALARSAGVSYVTMWKAVQALKKSGDVTGRYRIARASSEPSVIPPAGPSVDRLTILTGQFIRDLLAGSIIRRNVLLSAKELVARYGTSPQTLKRVLHAVHAHGLIVPYKRQWTRFSPSTGRRKSIVLIASMTLQRGTELTWLERDLLRTCEQACTRAGLGMRLIALRNQEFAGPDGTLKSDSVDAVPAGDAIAGYIYMAQEPQFAVVFLRRLLQIRKPLALADNVPLGGMRLRPAMVRRFRQGLPWQSGSDMAAYLVSKGHRHFAYISPFHADGWSQARFDGIQRIVKQCEGGTVAAFTAPYSINRHFSDQGYVHAHGRRIEAALTRWEASLPPAFVPDIELLKDYMKRIVYFDGEIRSELTPLMDAAASDERITAWIMANDRAGRMAISYCAGKGSKVPRAIVGFDDDPESGQWGLTSYNFNTEALAAAMVHFILHPEAGYWRGNRLVEIRGYTVARNSG